MPRGSLRGAAIVPVRPPPPIDVFHFALQFLNLTVAFWRERNNLEPFDAV